MECGNWLLFHKIDVHSEIISIIVPTGCRWGEEGNPLTHSAGQLLVKTDYH